MVNLLYSCKEKEGKCVNCYMVVSNMFRRNFTLYTLCVSNITRFTVR